MGCGGRSVPKKCHVLFEWPLRCDPKSPNKFLYLTHKVKKLCLHNSFGLCQTVQQVQPNLIILFKYWQFVKLQNQNRIANPETKNRRELTTKIWHSCTSSFHFMFSLQSHFVADLQTWKEIIRQFKNSLYKSYTYTTRRK